MNKINIGKEIKISMLGIVSGTLLLTLGEMIFSPLPEKKLFHEQHFPDEISLPGWQVYSSNLPQHFDKNKLQTIPGKSYQYVQNNSLVNTSMARQPVEQFPNIVANVENGYAEQTSESISIDIQMHYITRGHDVKTLLKKYTSLPHQSLKVLEQEKIGSYGVLMHQDKLHLSSCITPQGSSLVSNANFYQSYPAVQLLSDRLVFWLLGEKPIVENVCLWSHLSMPISDSSPEKAYLTLEKIWFSWYRHWHPYLVTTINSN